MVVFVEDFELRQFGERVHVGKYIEIAPKFSGLLTPALSSKGGEGGMQIVTFN